MSDDEQMGEIESMRPPAYNTSERAGRASRADRILRIVCHLSGDLAPCTHPTPRAHRSHQPGASSLTVAPSDAGEARRFVARTRATVCVSVPPIGRRRLCAPRPPAWPIAPGSIRARDAARESARRSRLGHAGPRQRRTTIRWAYRSPIVRPPKRRGRGGSRACPEPAKGRPGVIGHRQPPVPRRRPQRLDVHADQQREHG